MTLSPYEPPPPPAVSWYLADLLTGQMLTELPLDPGGTVKRVIAKVEQNQFNLPVMDDLTPANWADLLVDGKSMIVLTLNDVPTQAWVVIGHQVGSEMVPVTASTLEECLERTYVPDLEATLDDALALAQLLAPVAANFGFVVDAQACGKISDHEYSSLEDRKALDAANELMAADGGPEWRILVDWTDGTHRAFTKTIEIRGRIGSDRPNAIFDLGPDGRGVIDTYTRATSYAEGKGANSLIGTSEGSGSSRPMTDPMLSDNVAAGWPVWEERVNFTGLGAGIDDEDTELANRSRTTLLQRQNGTATWTVTGTPFAPRPGIDYSEGDTVHLDVAPQGKLDPAGGSAAVRVQGWELEPATGMATPQLWDDGSGDTDG